MGLLTAAVAAPAVEAGALSPFAADVLGGVVAFEVSLPFEIGASQLLPSADVSSGCGFCPAGGDLGPGPWSPSASGGFVLYPSKVNLNMATRVYSK